MADGNIFFLSLWTIFLLVILFILVMVLVRKAMIRTGMIQRSLNLSLLSVRFASAPEEPMTMQQVRERIALMEQFLSHLHSIRDTGWHTFWYGKPVFALELAIPHVGEELSFFIAVPRRLVPSVEKVVQGIFPDASIEETRDYNIFNPEGVASGAYVLFREGRYAPIRTYQKLEGDPMKEITNVFTKLAKTGEGASLQIVATPARDRWYRKLKDRAKEISGAKPEKNILADIVDFIDEFFRAPAPRETPSVQDSLQKKLTSLEDERVRMLEAKAGKALFEATVRIIASAPNPKRSEEILRGLEISFAQFTDPNSNAFYANHLRGEALKNCIVNFSFRGFEQKNMVLLSTEELTSIFHFPNVPLETPKLRRVKAREAPPPAELPDDGMLLGYNMFRGEKRDVRLLEEDRRRHLYIIGQTGTGKSVFLENMIVQDIRDGKGVCVIDPHGDMIERILGFVPRHRFQDVIFFNPGDIERPLGLNMLEYDQNFPEQKTFIVNELLGIFEKLYNMSVAGGPIFEQYFRNATMLVMDDPSSGNTLLEIERVMTDKAFRDLKLSRCKNIVVKNFWTQIAEKAGGETSLKDTVPYIVSKFDNFIANEIMRPIIAQEKSAFSIREVMDNQRILLVNLSKGRLGDINSSLIGLILVGKLLMAALSRGDVAEEKRKDFYLYIDEFQNVTTDSIATILSEARKYRLDLTITHQFVGQLKEEIKKAVFGNVGSMVSFRIGSDDAEFMAKQYKPVFSEQDLLNIDNFNAYVKLLIRGQTSPSFSMKTYPPEKGDKESAEIIKEMSRIKYGRPRAEVEAEIVARHTSSHS